MSSPEHLVIIGGVAGGASAAARARRHSESVRITLIERGPDVSFANCGLPYHIGGEITDRSRLAVQTPESLKALLALEVKTETEAIAINRESKTVTVKHLPTGQEESIPYDNLLLAPGASPITPPLEGIDSEGILTLRNLQDMDRIKSAAEATDSVLIIGAGFIGLEMAEQLQRIGKQVTVVELQPQVLPQVDPEITVPIAEELTANGIDLILEDGVSAFAREGDQLTATLNSGRTVQAGLIVLSIGVKPESGLAKAAGLELGPRGHIVVNEFQQTSDPEIYAAGDVCETKDPILDARTAIPLGGPANRQGRTVADHIFRGADALPYPGSIGTSIVRVFDQTVAATGYNVRRLNQAGVAFDQVTINASNHAGYYPGAVNITLKLLWEKDSGRILGAAAVGADGVDKRIDVIATAILGRLTVEDLCHVELSYSPPFGNAKDPVNIAAFAACNIRDGLVTPITDPAGLEQEGLQVVDIRPAEMTRLRPLRSDLSPINIPLPELRGKLDTLDKSRPVATVCAMGKTSYFASRILSLNGFDTRSLAGGITANGSVTAESPSSSDTTSSTAPSPDMTSSTSPSVSLDCTGLACPGPIVKVREAVNRLKPGEVLEVTASDGGFKRDLPAFCEANGLDCLEIKQEKGMVIGLVRRPDGESSPASGTPARASQDATLVIFSQEMDKVLAGLVIANGALAMGGQATMFFTFWGLNALRKPDSAPVKDKTLMDRMFGWMLPKGLPALPLSNMNFGGMGKKMMVDRMAAKDLPNLEGLLNDARNGGARLVACSMSMEAMGIRKEELIDGVEIGGVAEFLGASAKSGTNLFI
jgi:NADPH-dependent 2,4-dienoyl-CoA reductase/sulfur reductase-like enzyme/peroxiredoxin family protein/TusA-related sulfurtransferase/rhodanese-related sulfurtransferase